MVNNYRFRNHFSIVLQYAKAGLWVIVMALFSLVAGDNLTETVFTVGAWILLWLLLVVWRIVIWAKTWITINEQTIVVECSTWFTKKKHTIGIANISNINLEQSLLGMILGTCKLKLDTNSLSTAETTDVMIVLKKDKAEHVKRLLLSIAEGQEMQTDISSGIFFGGTDIFLHGLFSSRFLYGILVPLIIVLELVTEFTSGDDLAYMMEEVGNFATKTFGLGILILVAITAWILVTMVISLVRNVVRYWDFHIERRENKLVLNYGLAKKVNYSIPVDKIQAIVLRQTLLARICRRYMVEVVNVGMNDDEKEAQAFLLPYHKQSVVEQHIKTLLPEFADCLEFEVERQPKSVWFIWMCPLLLYFLIAIGLMVAVIEFAPELCFIAGGILLVIELWLCVCKVFAYLTEGVEYGEQFMLIVHGTFARQYAFLKYDKVQHVQFHQSFLAKRAGITRGTIHLLASAQNRMKQIPFVKDDKIELLKNKL